MVKYSYSAYGEINPIVDTSNNSIGIYNAIRYKGYFYDDESDMYYCKSRYYIPQWGRWLNADSPNFLDTQSLDGMNLFVYCGNNPVMYFDDSGNLPNWAKWLIGGVVIAGLAIATVATGGAAGGVAGFILAGALKGAVVGAISGAVVSGTIGGISATSNGGDFWKGFADGAADGFMSGAIIGGVTGAASNSFKVARAASHWDKGNFKSGFQSMKYHYGKHGVGYKNIINYSNQASNFALRNAGSLRCVMPANPNLQAHWTLVANKGHAIVGMNGQFTNMGKILTFWPF